MRCALVHDGVPIMAAGLPALGALLSSRGVRCEVWNLDAERRAGIPDRLEESAAKLDLLGLSLHWFYQLPAVLEIARRVRAAGGRRPFVVAGGITASVFPGELLEMAPGIDAVVTGDGELPLIALCGELAKARPRLEVVPNLVRRGRGGRPRESGEEPYVGMRREIDALDFGDARALRNPEATMASSAWGGITEGSRGAPFAAGPTWYLCGGRGCSTSCPACGGGLGAHAAHSHRTRFCFRSPARIVDDMEKAHAAGWRTFHACFDPTPGVDQWYVVMEEARRRRLRPRFIFECYSLPPPRFVRLFRETFEEGLLVVSPQTAREELRERCAPFFFTNRELAACLRTIGAEGLFAQVFFGYFVPGETGGSVEETLAFVHGLEQECGGRTSFFYYPFSTDPGSPIARNPAKHRMRCPLRSLADYSRELASAERFRGNLLRHFPWGMDRREWDILSLRIELERSFAAADPRGAARIRRRGGERCAAVYTGLARELAARRDAARIERGELARIVAERGGGGRA